ncbi:MAG: sodium ion-translocating decarboxylase subunit beta [Clostridia bacterium]|nr:sodium ion-translocating decarboxylase subunit beta [Clostridia bacterium]MBQ7315561.1 sodium ion-translocating decarboxylase subunit beta [Clostridia bacterium]
MLESIINFLTGTGIWKMFFTATGEGQGIFDLADAGWAFNTSCWQQLVMFAIVGVLVYLAIVKKFEPLLLLPIAIGMFLTNLPGAGLYHLEFFIAEEINYGQILHDGGFLDLLYLGVKLGIYPCLIFIGIGAMTDFSPLISNPKSLLIGAGAQLGVFVAFALALLVGFAPNVAAAIGIIGGADGPTAIQVTKTLAPEKLGAIAIAAYSYMALIPMIQPPFMRLLTTKKERLIKMKELRKVTLKEKILFPLIVTAVVGLIVPDALVLIGCLMFGNLLNVCGVTDRLSKTAQNELMNIVTIFLGISVGATASAANFLKLDTLLIIGCGLAAFCVSTCGGLLTAKLMNRLAGGNAINPLIGSAGVSAVPMAARVSQIEGAKYDPTNFLLMHAMGPNVAGVIGSAVAAGVFLSWFA